MNKQLIIDLATKRMVVCMIKNKINEKVYISQTTRRFNDRCTGAGIGVKRVLERLGEV